MSNVIDQDQQQVLQQMSSKWMAQVGQLSANNPSTQTPTDTIDILRLGLLRIGHILACVAEERGIQVEENSHVNNWQRARFIESSIQRSHSFSKQSKQQLLHNIPDENKVEVQFLQTNDPERPFRVMMIQSMDPNTWEHIQERQKEVEQAQKIQEDKMLAEFAKQNALDLDSNSSKSKLKKAGFLSRMLSTKKSIKFDSSDGSQHSSGSQRSKKSFWSFSRRQSGASQSNHSNNSLRESNNDDDNSKQILGRQSSRLFFRSKSVTQKDSTQLSELSLNSDNAKQDLKQKSSRLFFRSKSLSQQVTNKPKILQSQETDISQGSNNSRSIFKKKSNKFFSWRTSTNQQQIPDESEMQQYQQQQIESNNLQQQQQKKQQQLQLDPNTNFSQQLFQPIQQQINNNKPYPKYEQIKSGILQKQNLEHQHQQYSLPLQQNVEQQKYYQQEKVNDQDEQASISSTGYSDKQMKRQKGWKFAFCKLKKSENSELDTPKKKPSNWKALKKSFKSLVSGTKN